MLYGLFNNSHISVRMNGSLKLLSCKEILSGMWQMNLHGDWSFPVQVLPCSG